MPYREPLLRSLNCSNSYLRVGGNTLSVTTDNYSLNWTSDSFVVFCPVLRVLQRAARVSQSQRSLRKSKVALSLLASPCSPTLLRRGGIIILRGASRNARFRARAISCFNSKDRRLGRY